MRGWHCERLLTASHPCVRPAIGFNSTCVGMNPPGGLTNSGICLSVLRIFHPRVGRPPQCRPGPKGDTQWGGYEDALLEREVLR